VKISDPQGCGRFTGRVIRNVDPGAPTPAWMKERLERAGQRAISALVDVTNYVMLELGRPLHVYDLDKLAGGIDVRLGRKGERVKLLNEMTVDVDESVLCITDRSGPIGLGGIMAATRPRPIPRHGTSCSSRRSSTRRRSPGARAATTLRAMRHIASSAAWTSTTTSPASSARPG